MNHGERRHEATLVVILSSIEPERLLIEVAEQMERFHAHIGALDSSFQQAPEVLDTVSVNIASHIFRGMIDHLVRVVSSYFQIGIRLIAKQSGTWHHMLTHGSLN